MVKNKWLSGLIASVLLLMTGVVSASPVLISGLIENSDQYSSGSSLHLSASSGYPANVLFHRDQLQEPGRDASKQSNFIILLPEGETTTIAVRESGYNYCHFTVSVDKATHAVLSGVVAPVPAPGVMGCTISGDFNDDTFTIHLARDLNE